MRQREGDKKDGWGLVCIKQIEIAMATRLSKLRRSRFQPLDLSGRSISKKVSEKLEYVTNEEREKTQTDGVKRDSFQEGETKKPAVHTGSER